MNKVFCCECKHSGMGECFHPNNLKDTPKSRDIVDKSQEELNQNNNCYWFVKRKFYQEPFVFGLILSLLFILAVYFLIVKY